MGKIDLTATDWQNIEREYCKRSLANFAKQAWHVLEPASDLKWGWALDAICLHLEAVTNGDIKRLLMNVPPGSMKSLLTGVLWPAWEWGPKGMPHMRFIGTAHEESLAIRDSRKMRELVRSEWYQSLWPIDLSKSSDGKTEFENNSRGTRIACSFTSMTGKRGDRVILDDPISAHAANSEAKLEDVRITFTETLPTRINNENSAIVVIMQRLSEKDTSGVILSRKLPYVHLCIPMRYEAERHCTTSIGWSDPRTKQGELMFPERFNEQAVSELENQLQAYGTAGQLQQRPAPRGGGMFKADWFKRHHEAPRGLNIYITSDYAVTEGAGDQTEIGVWGMGAGEMLYQLDWWHGQTTSNVWIDELLDLVEKYKPLCVFGEGGVIEKAIKPQLTRRMREKRVYARMEWIPSIHDKATRARSFQARSASGLVSLRDDEQGERLIDQLTKFTGRAGGKDDAVDVCSQMGLVIDQAHAGILPVGEVENAMHDEYAPTVSAIGGGGSWRI